MITLTTQKGKRIYVAAQHVKIVQQRNSNNPEEGSEIVFDVGHFIYIKEKASEIRRCIENDLKG